MATHGQVDVGSIDAWPSPSAVARPRRVVVVDADTRLHPLFPKALRSPEFAVFCFADPHVGLVRLSEIGPDVIVCAAGIRGLIGKSIHRAARSSPQLESVPFIFLTADPGAQRELEPLLSTDACLDKPFSADALLQKVRRAANAAPASARPAGGEAVAPSLSGQTDRKGLFALMRLMEDARLTGRFVLETSGHRLFVDWLAGMPVGFGATPAAPDGDPLGLLLSTEGGRYGFEAREVKSSGRRGQRARAGSGQASGRSPIGRFANVELGGRRIQVFTEGIHTPNFTIVTVVAAAGVGVRKVESCWRHPLKRASDYTLANQEVNRQHESVLAMVKDGVVTPQPRRAVWDVVGGGVEGDLLIWVLSLLRGLVAERLGTLPALALLRRELARCAERHLALREFRVEDDGTVSLEAADEAVKRKTLSGWRLPRGAVEGVAAWAAAMHAEASSLVGVPRLPSLRDCIRMRKAELDAIGFYEALPGNPRS